MAASKIKLDNATLASMYDTYCQTISSNEARRLQFSAIYLTLISTGLAAIGSGTIKEPLFIFIPALIIAILWHLKIRYFKKLAEAKFTVIEKFEKKLGFSPFALEWKHLKDQNLASLTTLENWLPILIAFSALAYILYRICNLFSSYL